MAIPGVEGTSLIGKAPDVNRQHDSSQQNLAAQATQDTQIPRRAERRRRKTPAPGEPDRMTISRDQERGKQHDRPAPHYRPDAEVNGDEDTSEHEIDTRA
jgi:hypothetical protein